MADVKLLSEPTNYAVVHLPGRAFPGIVFQGDSLASFVGDLEQAIAEPDPSERAVALDDLIERLRAIKSRYEDVLAREGIPLPYSSL